MGIEVAGVLGGASILGGIMGADAAGDAAQMQADQNYLAMREQQRQFDLTRQDLSPFLNAATGQNGALNQLMSGINQAPGIPSLPGAITNAPTLEQFNANLPQQAQLAQFGGRAVQAPGLEQFSFDPNQALNNPALQFQREMGQQQIDRLAGKNRLLGSGQRLIAAEQLGQGLAAQSLGDEFNRQLAQNQQRNAVRGQQFGMAGTSLGQAMDIANLQNQIRQQQAQQGQIGFGNQVTANQLRNQTRQQQYGLNVGANEGQTNRLLQQYGLQSNDYNQRLNRLAGIVDVGRGTGTALGAAGMQTAGNIGNLMQNTGQAQAQGEIGRANAYSNMLQQGALLYGMSGGFGGASPSMNASYAGGIPTSQWLGRW